MSSSSYYQATRLQFFKLFCWFMRGHWNVDSPEFELEDFLRTQEYILLTVNQTLKKLSFLMENLKLGVTVCSNVPCFTKWAICLRINFFAPSTINVNVQRVCNSHFFSLRKFNVCHKNLNIGHTGSNFKTLSSFSD